MALSKNVCKMPVIKCSSVALATMKSKLPAVMSLSVTRTLSAALGHWKNDFLRRSYKNGVSMSHQRCVKTQTLPADAAKPIPTFEDKITIDVGATTDVRGVKNPSSDVRVAAAASDVTQQNVNDDVTKRKVKYRDISFDDVTTAFSTKSSWELARALSVLWMCSFESVADNSLKVGSFILFYFEIVVRLGLKFPAYPCPVN
jgi:hypothetical protein